MTLITQYHQAIVFVHKLRDTFDDINPILGYQWGKKYKAYSNDIAFYNVSYNYNTSESSDVIKNFTCEIKWWKKTAFVGLSWSGKSTLIKLIAWYLHPTEWYITIDDQQLPYVWMKNKKYISLDSYYPYIGYLTQEPNVFDWTIRENLMYWVIDGEAREEDMIRALQLAQCYFVFDFKDGLDTEIWEKGIRLSWWQRQRLAIAKIILKNPKIILLDEPTSALDSFSEEEVTKAFDALFEWRTVIIIAHRLQTVKKADEIIVLDQWVIIERWSHEQLVMQWWQYAKMLELQSGF